jgi:hypothetical protein
MVCRKHIAITPPYPVYNFTIEHGQGMLTEGAIAVPLQSPAEEVKLPQKPKAKSGLFAEAMSKKKPALATAPESDSPQDVETEKSAPAPESPKKKVRFSFKTPDGNKNSG